MRTISKPQKKSKGGPSKGDMVSTGGGRKSKTKYKGVSLLSSKSCRRNSWGKLNGKYAAKLSGIECGSGLNCFIGFFDTEREAALARDKKIISLGLNIPLQILKRK